MFCDVRNSKIWGQTVRMCSSINVYPIDKLQKPLAYHDSNNIWECFYLVTAEYVCEKLVMWDLVIHTLITFQGLVMYQCISTGLKQCVLCKNPLVQFNMVSGRQGTKVEGHCFF